MLLLKPALLMSKKMDQNEGEKDGSKVKGRWTGLGASGGSAVPTINCKVAIAPSESPSPSLESGFCFKAASRANGRHRSDASLPAKNYENLLLTQLLTAKGDWRRKCSKAFNET